MTAAAQARALTVADAARILHAALLDKSYQQTPLGQLVRRYMRWFRNEWGATPATLRDYEAILARMSLQLAHREPYEVDIEDLRAVIDLWADRTARTRQKVTSVIRAFWSWCEEQGHIAISPAARIRRPRAERKVAQLLPLDARPRLLRAAMEPRDRLGLHCLLGLGMRKDELSGLQVCNFDEQRGWVRVFGKGQKERLLPLKGPITIELRLFLSADLPHVGRPPEPDDYVLFPAQPLAAGKNPDGTIRWTHRAKPKSKPSPQSVHRWWYRQLREAGLVGEGVTSGMNMHRARHTFATELRRVAGIDAASHALGHSDLSTTLGIYGHRDSSDLESAMSAYARWLDSSVPTEG